MTTSLSGEMYVTSHMEAISSGVMGVSSSFFCICIRSSPESFSMIRIDPSENPMSILSKGTSERYLTSPFMAA